MNQDFIRGLNNKVVRDLYWLLFEPSPLNKIPEGFNIPLFPSEIINAWEETSSAYFEQLDQYPADLKRFVDRGKNKRLGFYCESLLSYFFQTFPGITLWLQNVQIREEKRTVGEIDFVISWQGRLIHLELAVKYYLLLPESNPLIARNWIGPSRKDDLHKKLTKVENRQLPLGKHSVVRDLLPDDLKNLLESFFLLKGHFFTSNKDQTINLLGKKPSSYYFGKDIKNQAFQVLRRPDWLGSFYEPYNKNKETKPSIDRPALVKLTTGNNVFIVPDDWNDDVY